MAIVHRIAAPENESETKAITTLAKTLPSSFIIFHNFELCTGRGLPYEYDMCVIGEFCVWHVEVKGYRGRIKGNKMTWVFENGSRQPSPIPLANKKSKILAGRINERDEINNTAGRSNNIWVETCILLTDDKVSINIQDSQSHRVVKLQDAHQYFTNKHKNLPVRTTKNITSHHARICNILRGHENNKTTFRNNTNQNHLRTSSIVQPMKKLRQIGLYDIIDRINQTENRTVFLARHRYIRNLPLTIIKVFHFDVYNENRGKQIEAIFHDREACRLLGAHPNLVDTWSMFAWEDDKFVLPTEYIDEGRPLSELLHRQESWDVSWKEELDWVVKIARGLEHAHSRGVVHRDLCPLNVVVAPGGVVKLVNFDLAKVEGTPLRCHADDLRKRLNRRYVAPETWVDPWDADERSDIYSLGVIFYELVVGQPPYEDVEELMEQKLPVILDTSLLKRELTSQRSNNYMTSPDDAVAVIEKMLQFDRSDRHASVSNVIEDLSVLQVLDGIE